MHLNPDSYLQTATGRFFTPQRNAAAWAQLYADLSDVLAREPQSVIMVMGIQGSGKSTWVRKALGSNQAIYVDSTFATKDRRRRTIEIAKAASVSISAVWIKAKLEVALLRNSMRSVDEQVPDVALENVYRIFEQPSLDEGFCKITILGNDVGMPER